MIFVYFSDQVKLPSGNDRFRLNLHIDNFWIRYYRIFNSLIDWLFSMATITDLFVIRLWVPTFYFQQFFSYIIGVSFINEVNLRTLFTESNWHCFSYIYETVCSAHRHSINRAIKILVIQELLDELSRNCLPIPCIRAQLRCYVRFVLFNLYLSGSLFVFLSFFIWSLYYLSVPLITPLASSYFSYNIVKIVQVQQVVVNSTTWLSVLLRSLYICELTCQRIT